MLHLSFYLRLNQQDSAIHVGKYIIFPLDPIGS